VSYVSILKEAEGVLKGEEIIDLISRFVKLDPKNRIPGRKGLKLYEEPLVAFADGSDPIYEKLKNESVIGEHHRSPGEWLEGARSVISYFLPFSMEIVESNKTEGLPSDEWYQARYWGEEFNNVLRAHLVESIEEAGHRAVAPVIEDEFETYRVTSNWSERHTAFIAGLGTFCLSYALISEKGCAGRYGSVVTDIELPVSPGAPGGLMDNCLGDGNGDCDICIKRCPAGAITREGKDHEKCRAFIVEEINSVYGERHGYFAGGCGKCQTNTPCARTNPRRGK
jgi:epoxyqueuosine reductase QueG